jgi:hypothetical protein
VRQPPRVNLKEKPAENEHFCFSFLAEQPPLNAKNLVPHMSAITDIPKKGPLSEFRPTFTRYVMSFGVTIIATPEVPDAKLLHSLGVLAQYLDNDQDGIADNKVALALAKRNAVVLMTNTRLEYTKFMNKLGGGITKALNDCRV